MAHRGRRAGLRFGWLVGLGGALLAVLAVALGTFVGLVTCMVLLGVGHASNQLSRFAAADMHEERRRPTVLGWVVWAGTIGAVLGPSLLGPMESVARMLGVTVLTSGFLVAIAFYAAALLCGAYLRPDPSEIAEEDTTTVKAGTSFRDQTRLPHVRIAVLILVTAQLAMTAIMTMTPLHIREHGHGVGLIGVIMSAHFVGMFALAPVIGSIVARVGSIKVALAGLSVVIIAAIGAAIVPGHSPLGIGAFLFLLGVGWCMGFVAGSSLLTRGLPYIERVRLQGAIDATVWTASALASLASGILLSAFGYATLALLGAIAVVGPLVVVGSGRRRLDVVPVGQAGTT
jgi:MFS family permease